MDNKDNIFNYPIYTGFLHKCCYCQTMFISLQFLLKHQNKCINAKIFLLLKEKILSRTKITKPKKNQDLTKSQKEKESNKNAKVRREKKKSVKFNTSQDLFKCNECEKVYKREWYLKRHVILHQNDNEVGKIFECKFCSNRFIEKHLFQSHMKTHPLEDKKFSCSQCFKKFKYKGFLDRHMKSSHPEVKT